MQPRPLLLKADNFTPPSRTPWGGSRIVGHYKRDLGIDGAKGVAVGESWEVSVGPDFPSMVDGADIKLVEAIDASPSAWLGEDAARRLGGSALLVKLLDAEDNLSVQIHPSDDYAGLEGDESGKPESWYVLDAREGAGLYLGMRKGVTAKRVREAIVRGEDVSALLFFVPVVAGDFFVIGPGTAHAIGRGVTLVEPQRVAPGRKGVTYRYWDWNRRYDAQGRPRPDGSARPLHLDHALSVTNWSGARENDLLTQIRYRADAPSLADLPRIDVLSGEGGHVQSRDLEVTRLAGTGEMPMPEADCFRGLTVVDGEVRIIGDGFDLRVRRGRSAAIPAALRTASMQLDRAHAIISAAH